MTRWPWLWLLVPPCLFLLMAVAGCAAPGPPPQATAIPYDPNLVTQSRQAVADQWAADLARRNFIQPYMNALCAPDGPWAAMNATWASQLKSEWIDVLWRFQPIPNAPPSNSVDWGKVVESLIGVAVKVAPLLATPKGALPPGVPPC
jgi:hypothetical protein